MLTQKLAVLSIASLFLQSFEARHALYTFSENDSIVAFVLPVIFH